MLSPSVAPSMARALSFASSENSTTMKTGDSPYMGRLMLLLASFRALLMGPWPEMEAVGSGKAHVVDGAEAFAPRGAGDSLDVFRAAVVASSEGKVGIL